ncbi:MAG: hypothetical protein K2Y27_05665 [Xanthobacteraceae bacterium]|nr:hypothetical protein [Xanthobacteraceae bacterium]
MLENLRELHRLEAELARELERLRQEAERKPNTIISLLYTRVVAECESVRAEIAELTHAVLAEQRPQGSA